MEPNISLQIMLRRKVQHLPHLREKCLIFVPCQNGIFATLNPTSPLHNLPRMFWLSEMVLQDIDSRSVKQSSIVESGDVKRNAASTRRLKWLSVISICSSVNSWRDEQLAENQCVNCALPT